MLLHDPKNIDLLRNCDVVFISYDEPNKEDNWNKLINLIPQAKRIDSVKGFDRAHKKAASIAKTDFLVIIDGDNQLKSPSLKIPKDKLNPTWVLSFSSTNSVNALEYGNGGLKCWPKELLLATQTHEAAQGPREVSDFCFTTPYYQMPAAPTWTMINKTPSQAFRAGYREGVKMCLKDGMPLSPEQSMSLEQALYADNLFRLKCWCELGRDVEHGHWAMLGARLGALHQLQTPSTVELIHNYDYLKKMTGEMVLNRPHEEQLSELRHLLKLKYNLDLLEYGPDDSSQKKLGLQNPPRDGLISSLNEA